jgi:hypothetical protein
VYQCAASVFEFSSSAPALPAWPRLAPYAVGVRRSRSSNAPPAPTTDGTGIYLPGNAVRALNSLGLGAQVAAAPTHARMRLKQLVEPLGSHSAPVVQRSRCHMHCNSNMSSENNVSARNAAKNVPR